MDASLERAIVLRLSVGEAQDLCDLVAVAFNEAGIEVPYSLHELRDVLGEFVSDWWE